MTCYLPQFNIVSEKGPSGQGALYAVCKQQPQDHSRNAFPVHSSPFSNITPCLGIMSLNFDTAKFKKTMSHEILYCMRTVTKQCNCCIKIQRRDS